MQLLLFCFVVISSFNLCTSAAAKPAIPAFATPEEECVANALKWAKKIEGCLNTSPSNKQRLCQLNVEQAIAQLKCQGLELKKVTDCQVMKSSLQEFKTQTCT